MYITLCFLPVFALAGTGIDGRSISAGENIVEFLKNKTHIGTGQIAALRSSLKNTPFAKLNPTLQELGTLVASKSTDLANCSLNAKSEANDFLEKEFQEIYTRQCVSNVFAYTLQDSTAEITDNTLKYLSEYIVKGNPEQLVDLIKKQKNNTKNYQKISVWINKLMSSDLLIPNNELIENIEIDPAITNYLYKKMDNQLNFSSFKSEINSMSLGLMNRDGQEDISNNTKYFISYLHQNRDFLHDRFISQTLNKTGRFLIINQFNNEAKDLFTYNTLINGQGPDYDAIFYPLILAIMQGDAKNIASLIEENKLIEHFKELSPRLKYWVAKQSEEDVPKALALYESLIANHPFDFYSIAAIGRYQALKGNEAGVNKARTMYLKPNTHLSKKQTAPHSQDHYKRLAVWLKLGNHSFSDLEVKTILKNLSVTDAQDRSKHDGIVLETQYLSKVLAENNGLIHLFSNLQKIHALNHGDTSIETLKTSFPLKYINLVKKNTTSDMQYLVLSLIRQESAFQERALSNAGAIGLMQIMPQTGRLVQRGMTSRKLLHPDANVKVGTKYLKHLISYYGGNVIYALAAYNAGTSRVNRWSSVLDKFKENPMLIMELIPYDETNNYVKYIYRNLFFYNLLYEKKATLPKATLDFATGVLET